MRGSSPEVLEQAQDLKGISKPEGKARNLYVRIELCRTGSNPVTCRIGSEPRREDTHLASRFGSPEGSYQYRFCQLAADDSPIAPIRYDPPADHTILTWRKATQTWWVSDERPVGAYRGTLLMRNRERGTPLGIGLLYIGVPRS